MTKGREIRVNDVDRYAKSSDQLVLEEYSSCEVPAGCGGAILRWIDPAEALPLHLWLWTTGAVDLFFDGAPTQSSRLDVRVGAHALAFCVRPQDGAPVQLALALRYSDKQSASVEEPHRSREIGRQIQILSGAGAVLVGSSVQPEGDGWKLPAFDDSGWTALQRAAKQKPEARAQWHLERVQKAGGYIMELSGSRGPLWVRCTFSLTLGGAP